MSRLRTLPPRLSAQKPRLSQEKRADPLYRQKEWAAFARDMKRLLGGLCVRCGCGERIVADHIREVKDGGAPFDPRNIQLLCHPCHAAKTASARRARLTAAEQ